MKPLRLATYNIHRAVGRDGLFDPARIRGVLAEVDADIVALQEVESRHGGFDTLAYLATQTHLKAIAGPTLVHARGEYGNALLTRPSPLHVRRLDLSVPDREPRGALDVLLDCDGAQLRVVATHLGLRPAERRHQIRHLLAHLDLTAAVPTVLTGDLNEWFLWGRPLRWLRAVFDAAPAPATFPSGFPVFALDRVWVKPQSRLRQVFAHSTALARHASDHLPLVALVDACPR